MRNGWFDEKKRRGRGLPSILYVKSFMVPGLEARSVETDTSTSDTKDLRSVEIGTSASDAFASRSAEIVTSRPEENMDLEILKLNSSHVEYAIECFNQNTTKVRNIKKYMLAILFNAPTTIGSYYTAEVPHDMPYLEAK